MHDPSVEMWNIAHESNNNRRNSHILTLYTVAQKVSHCQEASFNNRILINLNIKGTQKYYKFVLNILCVT